KKAEIAQRKSTNNLLKNITENFESPKISNIFARHFKTDWVESLLRKQTKLTNSKKREKEKDLFTQKT
ncbi:MAG: hypothetical protein II075_06000, partial [Bacteroidales bacterium]|nr:hypothetical protein [Bacteroidales bacterium]